MSTPTLAELFQEHAAFVGRLLRYLGVPESELDDACQEAFLVAHKKLGSLRPDVRPGSWLYGICIHVSRDAKRQAARRRARTEPLDSEPEYVGEVGADVAHATRQEALLLLSVLDEEKREVFLLHDVEGLTMREICDTIDIPLQTGYSRLRLARERLQQKVNDSRARELHVAR
jgi:RNA polymerase sigma-70 factor (ECF subfamily)